MRKKTRLSLLAVLAKTVRQGKDMWYRNGRDETVFFADNTTIYIKKSKRLYIKGLDTKNTAFKKY